MRIAYGEKSGKKAGKKATKKGERIFMHVVANGKVGWKMVKGGGWENAGFSLLGISLLLHFNT